MSDDNSVEQTMEKIIENRQEEVGVLRQQSKVTKQKVRELENIVDENDDRLREQEAYTRNDSVRIMNPPFDAKKTKHWWKRS